MQENLKKTSHITYKEYNKQVTNKSNEGITIFVSAFFILLLLFLGIAKQISPEVDVSIGGESNQNSESVGIDKTVDDRLKLLQLEDNGDNMFASELDEKVVIPEPKKEEARKDKTSNEEVITLVEKQATPAPSETASAAPEQTSASKVVVGYYTSKEQAEVAKGIIAESGMNISPFVRNIGGAYTIQVGSYSSREKAQSVANDLLRNNYPARVISE